MRHRAFTAPQAALTVLALAVALLGMAVLAHAEEIAVTDPLDRRPGEAPRPTTTRIKTADGAPQRAEHCSAQRVTLIHAAVSLNQSSPRPGFAAKSASDDGYREAQPRRRSPGSSA